MVQVLKPLTRLSSVPQRLRRLRESRLARNSAWMMAGQCASVVLQTGYFFILARLLGSRGYGVYVGAVAFCSLLSQYAANGAGTLFLRHVSVDSQQHGRYLGNIFLSVLALGSLVVLALGLAAPYLINRESAALVLIVAVGECICRQCTDAIARVFQAYEQMKTTALVSLLGNAARFGIASAMLLVFHHATARAWAAASTLVSVLSTGLLCLLAARAFGRPVLDWRLFALRFSEGFGFSFAGSTFSIYNDIDKTMLSHYGMNAANGLYSMAYRVVDMATMPSWSIYAAGLSQIFHAGSAGIQATRPLAGRMLRGMLAVSLPVVLAMVLAAPLLPRLVGPSFHGTVDAVRWLAVLPLLRCFQLSGGAALTGAGYQRYRTAGQLSAAFVNFALNLYLIPHRGWLGAAWASLATDSLIGVLNWLLLLRLTGRAAQAEALTAVGSLSG